MMGRTHGVHAEPTTFGVKMALWYAEMKRNFERFKRVREEIELGKMSGAVGTFANIPPEIEAHVCKELGLDCAPVSTQTLQRDASCLLHRDIITYQHFFRKICCRSS